MSSAQIKKIIRRGIYFCIIILLFLIIYTHWDNNRVIIVEQSISIEKLPNDFEDFKILQITDLHERVFGEKQQKLIKAINSVEYDVIVFTGDMLDDPDSTNFATFYMLIEGIENKNIAFFVPGNTDPDVFVKEKYNPIHDFIKGMEDRGVKLLDTFEEIKVGDSNLYLTYFENSIIKKINELDTAINDSDLLIALNHYPVPDGKIDLYKKSEEYAFRNYDLIIAGHYHGGQIRLPFIGAVFIPESSYSNGGFLPPQDRVKGLWEYKGIQQYVSAGLGSSDAIPFLKFRFLNTPEINVLTLKRK